MRWLNLVFILFLALFLIAGCDDSGDDGTTNDGTNDGTELNNNTNNDNNTNDATEEPPPDFMIHPAKVEGVIDGDTIRVLYNGYSIKIRVRGIDCPEIAHPQEGTEAEPFANEATNYTTQHARPGTWVGLEFDENLEYCKDYVPGESGFDDCLTYDRLLAYIRTREDQDLGAQLLINGLAEVYMAAEFDRKSHYLELQDMAQDAGRGIWSLQQ